MSTVEEIQIKFGVRPSPAEPKKKASKRRFSGAKIATTLSDWLHHDLSADQAILTDYVRLRGRSRDLFRNNSWAKQFRWLLISNVIGPRPVQLENCARNSDGSLSTGRNEMVKDAWERWQRQETCTVSRDTTYHSVETSTLASVAADGFAMVRKVRGFDNGWNFALQPLSADYLDHEMEEVRPDGNRVRGGVERNRWGEPVAYYLFQENPSDFTTATRYGPRQRVPADQIIFLFRKETADQTIGVPWLAPSLVSMRHMDEYLEAALVDARVSACKTGYIQKKQESLVTGSGLEEGDEDDDFAWDGATDEVEPGVLYQVPDGYEFGTHSPNNPNSEISEFTKTHLRAFAAGQGVASFNLSNDYSDVNFSSARMGNSYEHGNWRGIQHWWIEDFEREVFMEWYPLAILSGQLAIPPRFAESACQPTWLPRGWESPDPDKESRAVERNIKMGLTSRTREAAKKGQDSDEVFEELKKEQENANKLGINISTDQPTASEPVQAETDEGEEVQLQAVG